MRQVNHKLYLNVGTTAVPATARRQRLGADVGVGAGGLRAHYAGRVAADGGRDAEVYQLESTTY